VCECQYFHYVHWLECRNYTEPFICRAIFADQNLEREKTEEERWERTNKVTKKKKQKQKMKKEREEGNNDKREKETERNNVLVLRKEKKKEGRELFSPLHC
jgi:hypothetical protein